MDITYRGTFHRTAFRNIKPGEMFRNQDCNGLFIRLPGGSKHSVMVIDPLAYSDSAANSGEFSTWPDDDVVYPVKSIDVTLYNIGG